MTEKQFEANRENAQKSTGPTSAEGKERSKLNAMRHGLTGQTIVMAHEDMQAFIRMKAKFVEHFQCIGPVETQLAESYAAFQWRINRAVSLEEGGMSMGLIDGNAENLNIENAQAHNAMSNFK